MLIKRRRGWEIPESLATPEALVFDGPDKARQHEPVEQAADVLLLQALQACNLRRAGPAGAHQGQLLQTTDGVARRRRILHPRTLEAGLGLSINLVQNLHSA